MSINREFVTKSYNNMNIVEGYLDANNKYGLSVPEFTIISKYVNYDDKIIDIGCGVGRVGFGLYENGYKKVTGIDISKEMIKEAKKINDIKQFELTLEVQDILDLKYQDRTFNSALAFHAITPIPKSDNRRKALLEIQRILNNDSYIILSTFLRELRDDDFWINEQYVWKNNLQDKRLHDFGDILGNKNGVEIFIHIPSRIEFINLLEESGYKLLEEFLWTDLVDKNCEVSSAQKCKYWIAKAKK